MVIGIKKEIFSPFLGVEKSVTGKLWRRRLEDERLVLAFSQKFELPEIVARVIAARGVTLDQCYDFLNPRLKKMLPEPNQLKDMEPAVELIVRAVKENETIAVFGDYDVDGATSSAILVQFFSMMGLNVPVHIPDRQKEGYGPNLPALIKLKEKGASVIITVDCGTTAFEPLEAAARAGLQIIVVDHHVAEPRLPKGSLVINPNRFDETSEHGQLAAVGVTFLLIIAFLF